MQVRCFSISRTQFSNGLDYLKSRVHIQTDPTGAKPSVILTGLGSAQFEKEIQDTFNVKYVVGLAFIWVLHNKSFVLWNRFESINNCSVLLASLERALLLN